ncbi:MAG: DUF1549 domain-containing protein, partial [Planctomycetota bacterium]
MQKRIRRTSGAVVFAACCAAWVVADTGGVVAESERAIAERVGEHWAFVPLRDDLPQSGLAAYGTIDGWIDARLDAKNIEPAPACDDATWLRRVYLDLIGIPPSVEDQRQFLEG